MNTSGVSELVLRGTTLAGGHPCWGANGRPILIGDRAQHEEHGEVRVASIADDGRARVRNDAGWEPEVHVQELSLVVSVNERLLNAERLA